MSLRSGVRSALVAMSRGWQAVRSPGSGASPAARRPVGPTGSPAPPPGAGDAPGRSGPDATAEDSPGRSGPAATVEVDPRALGQVRMAYSPRLDGRPDPGEIVWTWVPFVEHDGRGKDRPVLVVAESHGSYLAVQLTSKPHRGDDHFVAVGAGGWDRERRPSWVNVSRVLRLQPDGLRRESVGLDRDRFERVADALRTRYSWR